MNPPARPEGYPEAFGRLKTPTPTEHFGRTFAGYGENPKKMFENSSAIKEEILKNGSKNLELRMKKRSHIRKLLRFERKTLENYITTINISRHTKQHICLKKERKSEQNFTKHKKKSRLSSTKKRRTYTKKNKQHVAKRISPKNFSTLKNIREEKSKNELYEVRIQENINDFNRTTTFTTSRSKNPADPAKKKDGEEDEKEGNQVRYTFDIQANEKLSETYTPPRPNNTDMKEMYRLVFGWNEDNFPDGVHVDLNDITLRAWKFTILLQDENNLTQGLKHVIYPEKVFFGAKVKGHPRYQIQFRSSNERSGILVIIPNLWKHKDFTVKDKFALLQRIKEIPVPVMSTIMDERKNTTDRMLKKTRSFNCIFYIVDYGPNEEYEELFDHPLPYNLLKTGETIFVNFRRGESIDEYELRLKAAGKSAEDIKKIITKKRSDRFINETNAQIRLTKATEEEKSQKKKLKEALEMKIVELPTKRDDILKQLINAAKTREEKERYVMKRLVENRSKNKMNPQTKFAMDMNKEYDLENEEGCWREVENVKQMRDSLLEAIRNHKKEKSLREQRILDNYQTAYGDQDDELESLINDKIKENQAKNSENKKRPLDKSVTGLTPDPKKQEGDEGAENDLTSTPKEDSFMSARENEDETKSPKPFQLPTITTPKSTAMDEFGKWNGLKWNLFKFMNYGDSPTILTGNNDWKADNNKPFINSVFNAENANQMLDDLHYLFASEGKNDPIKIDDCRRALYFYATRARTGRFSRGKIEKYEWEELHRYCHELINYKQLVQGNVISLVPIYFQIHAITKGNTKWPNNTKFGLYATPYKDSNNVLRLLSKADEKKSNEDKTYLLEKDFIGHRISNIEQEAESSK